MGFNEITAAAQAFSESTDLFGEQFTYQNTAMVGVFNQVEIEYNFDDVSTRKLTGLQLVSSKPQWVTAGLVPADRGTITYGGIGYEIQKIDGANTAGEPAYTLTLMKLT